MGQDERNRKNLKMAGMLFALVVLMVGLSFASVPLYDLFCRVTGYGGTTGVSEQLPEKTLDRVITVRFNADTSRELPWYFKPDQVSVDVKLGQGGLTSYTARNESAKTVAGTAVYNVSPSKAGEYFKKIQCFCFDEQVLEAGQEVAMPVYFYIDPALNDDPMLDEVKTITLSYTFFKVDGEELDGAMEKFYDQ